jgi:hypothetical protein
MRRRAAQHVSAAGTDEAQQDVLRAAAEQHRVLERTRTQPFRVHPARERIEIDRYSFGHSLSPPRHRPIRAYHKPKRFSNRTAGRLPVRRKDATERSAGDGNRSRKATAITLQTGRDPCG